MRDGLTAMMPARYAFRAPRVALALLAGLMVLPLPADARDTSVLTHDPYPCSVLSRHPCHPTFCSVFSRHGRQPDINYPIGQDLRLTITSCVADRSDKPADAAAPDEKTQAAPERHLDTIHDIFSALRGCWVPPAMDAARATHSSVSSRQLRSRATK